MANQSFAKTTEYQGIEILVIRKSLGRGTLSKFFEKRIKAYFNHFDNYSRTRGPKRDEFGAIVFGEDGLIVYTEKQEDPGELVFAIFQYIGGEPEFLEVVAKTASWIQTKHDIQDANSDVLRCALAKKYYHDWTKSRQNS